MKKSASGRCEDDGQAFYPRERGREGLPRGKSPMEGSGMVGEHMGETRQRDS